MEMKLLKIINMNINLSDEKLNKNPMKGICQIKVIWKEKDEFNRRINNCIFMFYSNKRKLE